MCGILGLFEAQTVNNHKDKQSEIEKVLVSLTHRGPDQSGTWIDADNDFCLGHVRLSIHDLTDAGRQPMTSLCGRYVLVFNGEIYNFLQIKNLLIKDFFVNQWNGTSDTEVLLNAFIHIGFKKTLTL